MRSAIALMSLLALLLVVPLVTLLALSCGDAEGLAKLYENPTWPCRPDAVSAEGPGFGWEDAGTDVEYGICWQRCQAHQSLEEGECLNGEGVPDWGNVAELATAREWCKNEDYHTPTYDMLISLLDNCEDVGIDYEQDGGPADSGVHVTQYECEGCNQSDLCSEIFDDPMHGATYWSETRCPRDDEEVFGDPDEDWRGRWVMDFDTGESFCVRSTDEYATICVTEAPDPWPPMY